MPKKEFKFTDKQKELYNNCSKLQRNVVINMVHTKMSQRAAYYEAGGRAKTHKSADVNVSKMLALSKVKAFYDSLIETAAGLAIMTRERAMEILTEIGETNLTDVLEIKDNVVTIKNSDKIEPQHLRALNEVSIGEKGMKVKIHSAPAAIKQLADMEGWNSAQKHEHTGKDGGPIESKSLSDEDLARKLAFLLTKGDK